MSGPHLVIVGADKGGVGKTTIARLLMDYYPSRGVSVRGFDTQHPAGILQRFHADKIEIVDLEESNGQMQVLDGMSKAQVTLVDLGAGLLSKTLEKLTVLGFFDGLRDGSLRISVVHVIGSNKASYDEIEATAAVLTGATHHVLLNHTNKSKFHGLPGSVRDPIIVPLLDEEVAATVDLAGVGFSTFADDQLQSLTRRAYVKAWRKAAFDEFDRKHFHAA